MHDNSRLLFEKYATGHFHPSSRVLEIGPDRFPSTYQSIIGDDSITWDTLDLYEHDQLTYSGSAEYSFPVPDDTYDIVLSGQVIEHIPRIWVWMKEVARVCKPGGIVITINPVSWPYHEAPLDCWRVYPEGMKALYEDSQLSVLLSTWESLERPALRYRIPGRSDREQPKLLRFAYRALGLIGFPIECSFDTITIGRKRRDMGAWSRKWRP